MSAPYAWLTGSVAAWFFATGLHQVMVTWLLVGELNVAPARVGVVQMLGTLPVLALLLVAGATADRRDRRRLLMVLHGLAAALSLGLAAVVGSGFLSLTALIAYVVCWGALQAFTQPARDALISDLAARNLLRGVIGVTVAQFGALMCGARMAGLGEQFGNGTIIATQAVFLLLGIIPLSRVAHMPAPSAKGSRPMSLAEIRVGIREVRRTPGLFSLTLLVAANGLFFNGPFLVLVPIIVRDIYGASQQAFSLVMMALPMGTMIGSLAVFWRGRLRRKGAAFLLALLTVSLCLIALYTQPALPILAGLIALWGIAHSVFYNVSRTLFQEAAPATHRARVLAIHPLAFLGMSPISTLSAGLLDDLIGPLETCALAGGAMVVLTAAAWRRTSIRDIH